MSRHSAPASPQWAGYQDVFETTLDPADRRTAEQLVRDGLEGAPAPVRRVVPLVHRWVLLLRLGSTRDPDRVLGWQVEESGPDRVVLRAGSPLADALLVGERDGGRLRLTTRLRYLRPVAATVVWTAVGPLHRRIAPILLERAARGARGGSR